MRHQESDVVCLRGQLELHVEDGAHWPVPRGERLPAACARRPESSAYRIERLDLDWYETLIGRRARHESVDLDESGRSGPLRVADGTLLYVRAESRESGEITISFGDGQSRSFPIVGGKPLEIRVRLRGLGAGPRLRVEPAAAIKQIRLFQPR